MRWGGGGGGGGQAGSGRGDARSLPLPPDGDSATGGVAADGRRDRRRGPAPGAQTATQTGHGDRKTMAHRAAAATRPHAPTSPPPSIPKDTLRTSSPSPAVALPSPSPPPHRPPSIAHTVCTRACRSRRHHHPSLACRPRVAAQHWRHVRPRLVHVGVRVPVGHPRHQLRLPLDIGRLL